MGADDVKRSMRVPGAPGGSPLMDYNAAGSGQMKQQSLADVVTPAVAGAFSGPFSVVSQPVEGGVREIAGPAGSVPKGPHRLTPGVELGPPVRSAPGGDVFPKGSGTAADPALPSHQQRAVPAVEIKEIPDGRLPPVPGGYGARFPVGDSQLITVPNPGLQPGEAAGLLPRKGE